MFYTYTVNTGPIHIYLQTQSEDKQMVQKKCYQNPCFLQPQDQNFKYLL